MLILIYSYLFVASRDFYLAHASRAIGVRSWVVVEPNCTGLPSMGGPARLGAVLTSPYRAHDPHQTNPN